MTTIDPQSVVLQPIAHIRSPYRQKFAIPRQPNLVREAVGDIHFTPAFADANSLRGIEGFSHVWLVFLFHETADREWTPTVTPPRLGGTERVGVFASRSPYRPNSLGLSVVETVAVLQQGPQLILRVRGIDLLDGTPIFDIKPYVPYVDAIPNAIGGYAPSAPHVASGNADEIATSSITVSFSNNALNQIEKISFSLCDLKSFIQGVLSQDPRPAQHVRKADEREYGMHLYDFNVRWRVVGSAAEVLSVEPLPDGILPWKL
ncbi:MAG: tRNA (N6-threonylcarbamoyladenosine(37)-N6)-methyltransferase TrmO [Pseudomonadota bacterium]